MERKRPGGLLTVVVIGCILGGLGTCTGAFGVIGQIMQSQMQGMSRGILEASSQGNESLFEHQLDMQQRVEAVTQKYRVAAIAQGSLNLLASLGLLIGAILLVRWSPSAPTLFLAAAVASIVADVAAGTLGIVIQLETSEIMREYMTSVSSVDPNMPQGMDRTMGAVMDASANVGICFGLLWVLAKLAYYVFGIVYLRKPAVRALFTPA
jgi:hypothetical protein